jgi:hypothetical protein
MLLCGAAKTVSRAYASYIKIPRSRRILQAYIKKQLSFAANQRPHHPFEPICLDFVEGSKHFPQFPLWKALVLEPDNVGLRQVDEKTPFVLTKGHARVGELEKKGVLIAHFRRHDSLYSYRPIPATPRIGAAKGAFAVPDDIDTPFGDLSAFFSGPMEQQGAKSSTGGIGENGPG